MNFFFKIFAIFIFFAIVSCQPTRNPVRISQTKCESYKNRVLRIGRNNRKFYDCRRANGNIVGGDDAIPGEFPHMAAIGWKVGGSFAFPCGGSLISDKFVLTAAHCEFYKDNTPNIVRLGGHYLGNTDDEAEHVDYTIKTFIRHEYFKKNNIAEYDIAVIELNTPVKFTKFIRPACLYEDLNLPNKVIATGWGQNGTFKDPTNELQKVTLDVIDDATCSEKYESDELEIQSSQFCAGGTIGKDTCNGDSGGPIQTYFSDANCVYIIVGVTSVGHPLCGSETPAIYTRVSSYLDWIESKVWPQ